MFRRGLLVALRDGHLRPKPKARLVTFNPGADCLRLYSLRSISLITFTTVAAFEAFGDDLRGAFSSST